jgi:cell division protein FtsL
MKVYGMIAAMFVLLMLGIGINAELEKTRSAKESLQATENNLMQLASDISKYSFPLTELRENVEDFDLRERIKYLAGQTGIETVLLKNKSMQQKYFRSNEMEIRFSAAEERSIYDFIDGIRQQFLVEFRSIEITKKKNFLAKIHCILYFFEKKSLRYVTNLPNAKNIFDVSWGILFPCVPKAHQLNCVIENTKALVDDLWFNPGDSIDGALIKRINYNSIDLERDRELFNIKIGLGFCLPPRDFQ